MLIIKIDDELELWDMSSGLEYVVEETDAQPIFYGLTGSIDGVPVFEEMKVH